MKCKLGSSYQFPTATTITLRAPLHFYICFCLYGNVCWRDGTVDFMLVYLSRCIYFLFCLHFTNSSFHFYLASLFFLCCHVFYSFIVCVCVCVLISLMSRYNLTHCFVSRISLRCFFCNCWQLVDSLSAIVALTYLHHHHSLPSHSYCTWVMR